MRLPQFTAEAALGRRAPGYTNSSFWSGRHGAGSVIAQHLFCRAGCKEICSPPGCEFTGLCTHCICLDCPPLP
jgi:hypothetical protein